MPEGPEVQIISERLNEILKNCALTNIDIFAGRYLNTKPRGFNAFEKELPMIVKSVNSKGKFIYFTLISQDNEEWYIFNTLGLSGKWVFEKESHSQIEFEFRRTSKSKPSNFKLPKKSDKLPAKDLPDYTPMKYLIEPESVKKSNKFAMWFTDIRRFGTFIFTNSKEELNKKLWELGPDVLKENVGKLYLKKIIEKGEKKKIPAILMDQKKIAGLGNYLVPEILFRSGISPYRTGKSLTPVDITKLYKYLLCLPKLSYKSQGGIHNFKPQVKVSGDFRFKVYRQKYCPNGDKISGAKDIIKGRTVYWCPSCQN